MSKCIKHNYVFITIDGFYVHVNEKITDIFNEEELKEYENISLKKERLNFIKEKNISFKQLNSSNSECIEAHKKC